mmetsp:Transcript_23680/g.44232  ORF Transcript_23680/g.44232 Transcript_23680/m.44232 type:complete len:437 (-) Transcript_23680:1014-2324(-)
MESEKTIYLNVSRCYVRVCRPKKFQKMTDEQRMYLMDCLKFGTMNIETATAIMSGTKPFPDENTTIDEFTLAAPPPPRLHRICTFPKLTDKRSHIRAELVMTEQNYCESLVKFLTAYAYPLDVERNPKSIMQNRKKWIEIFDNFENIVRFHCDFFCPDLQACVTDAAIMKPPGDHWGIGNLAPTSPTVKAPALRREFTHRDSKGGENKKGRDIGAAFNKRVSLLKTVYEPYLANWTKLQELIKVQLTKPKYEKFFNDTQNANMGKGVSSFLIQPIQRLPRYVLLIQELVKRTDQEHPEYKSLQRALKSIQKIHLIMRHDDVRACVAHVLPMHTTLMYVLERKASAQHIKRTTVRYCHARHACEANCCASSCMHYMHVAHAPCSIQLPDVNLFDDTLCWSLRSAQSHSLHTLEMISTILSRRKCLSEPDCLQVAFTR